MHLNNIVLPYVLIIRPRIFLGVGTLVVLLVVIVDPNSFGSTRTFVAAIGVALSAGAGSVINDLFDLKADRINNPQRVLPRGLLTKRATLYYYILLLLGALLFSVFVNLTVLLASLATNLILFLYSWKLRRLNGLFSNITIALIVATMLSWGTLVTGKMSVGMAILFIFGLFISFAHEIVGDIRNLEGGQVQGLRTLPGIIGRKKSLAFAAAIVYATALWSYAPLMTGSFGNQLCGLVIPTGLVFLLLIHLPKLRKGNVQGLHTALKISMFYYPAAFALSIILF